MKTGKAYAFFESKSDEKTLLGLMEINKQKANFPENLSFTFLDDKLSDAYDHKRKGLPEKVAKAAKTEEVHGSAPMTYVGNLINIKPKKATGLRYLVMAKAPGVTNNSYLEPLGQSRANQTTSGMLKDVLGMICNGECESGASKFMREIVFYQDSRRRAQRY
jgi:hypothetical protein